MPDMTGSFEERQNLLREAINSLLLPEHDYDNGRVGPDCWVCIEATYPDRVYCTVTLDGEQDSYELPYEFTPEGEVSLGMPQPVKMSGVATPDENAEPDADDAASGDDAVTFRFLNPAADSLTDALSYVMAAPTGTEGKAFDDAVREPLLRLLDGLAVKGMDMQGVAGTAPMADEPPAASEDAPVDTEPAGDDPWAGLLDSEAEPASADAEPIQPAADAAPMAEEPAAGSDTVTLDPEQVKAELAGLQGKSDDDMDESDSGY